MTTEAMSPSAASLLAEVIRRAERAEAEVARLRALLEEREQEAEEKFLTPAEARAKFGVDPKTLVRWATAGTLTPVRTLGGHRRYRESEILALLEQREGGGEP